MNQREALKIAAWELMQEARDRADEYARQDAVIPDEWSGRDVDRVAQGFMTLAARLEFTATGKRATSGEPEDPDQYPLFDKEGR